MVVYHCIPSSSHMFFRMICLHDGGNSGELRLEKALIAEINTELYESDHVFCTLGASIVGLNVSLDSFLNAGLKWKRAVFMVEYLTVDQRRH